VGKALKNKYANYLVWHISPHADHPASLSYVEMTCYLPSSTILPNFIALHQPTPEISITKYLQTNKQTKLQTNKQ